VSGLPRTWNEHSYSAKQRNVVAPGEIFTQHAQYYCASTAWGEDPGDRTRSACSNREVAWHGCCNAHAVFVQTYPPPRPAPQARAGRKPADATGPPGLPAPDPPWPSLVSRRVPPGRAGRAGRAGKQASLSRPSSLYATPPDGASVLDSGNGLTQVRHDGIHEPHCRWPKLAGAGGLGRGDRSRVQMPCAGQLLQAPCNTGAAAAHRAGLSAPFTVRTGGPPRTSRRAVNGFGRGAPKTPPFQVFLLPPVDSECDHT
jgi:hypothetical protein